MNHRKLAFIPLLFCVLMTVARGQSAKRMIIFDQDSQGPGGTDTLSLLVLLQSPDVDVLGVTVVTGDGWRDEEVAHALRTLELVGRTDIPVVPGAAYPLVRTKEWTLQWEKLYGSYTYLGAFSTRPNSHGPFEVPTLREGNPTTKAADEDAAHFLVRMVRAHPHQVAIYAGGPLTNIALAVSLDPQFAELSNGIAIMGTSISPHTDLPEFATNQRHEFNVWFDPEATHIVLRAHWPSIQITTVDVSLETHFSQEMFNQISESQTPVALYVAKYGHPGNGPLWDELTAAAWVDPSMITNTKKTYMDINLDRGAGYGDIMLFNDKVKPDLDVQMVNAQMDVDVKKFDDLFVKLMSGPTPGAHNPLMQKDADPKK
jgi:inosine-uridine nucleoside N-ribohydrolase